MVHVDTMRYVLLQTYNYIVSKNVAVASMIQQ